MTDEVRDPELDGVRDAWHAPLPRREMHEQIVWACNRELHRTNFLPKESWWRFAAVAALVLVAAFAALTIGLRTHRPVNLALPESLQEPPREPVVPEGAAIVAPRKTPLPHVRSVGRKAFHASDRHTDLLVTRFYPLMDAPPPLGDGILVRVIVPASTMRIAGLPLWEGQIEGGVEADLLIGEDGIARTIRFVGFE